MTDALATLFEGKEIRALERAGEPWFPIVDLAAAWGIDRTTPHNILIRNGEAFRGFVCGVSMCDKMSPSETGFCVNERGLYLLIGKITTGKLKNKEAAANILRFQRWVPELIQKYRKHEIMQVPAAPDIRAELEEARELAMICGKSPESFQAVILRKHGKPELAAELKASGEIVRGETGWYTVTGLVELCNDPTLTAERLNTYLANCRENGEWKPFQYKEGKIWRLAPRGLPHGKEYPFNLGNGHSEPRISWRESILVAAGLKRPVSEDQMALPARAV